MYLLRPRDGQRIPSSEITPQPLYEARREWLKAAGLLGMSGLAGLTLPAAMAAPAQTSEIGRAHV